jgi:hypothetical protein
VSETAVRERPILFSGPMVRAILEGRKTQTRRVVKDQPNFDWSPTVRFYSPTVIDRNGNEKPGAEVYGASDESFGRKCPYGKPGDRLWVRETWGLFDTEPKDGPEGAHIYYRASDENLHECRYQLWRPSIHMPRWASRILLEITDIHVHHLLSITEEQALAEGCFRLPATGRITDVKGGQYAGRVWRNARDWYRELWDELNFHRGYGWGVNPWVWAITFRRIEA